MASSTSTSERTAPPLYWTKNLFIGHTMIDADHRRIFDIANRLRSEFVEQPEFSIVGEVLVELIEHTGDHFLREEALMKAVRFPGYEEHKLEHARLMQRVNDLHRQYMEGKADMQVEVSDYIRKALVPHIMNADMELGKNMRSTR